MGTKSKRTNSTLDVCTIDFIDKFRVPNVRATKLSTEISGPLKSLIITCDQMAQDYDLYVPELNILKDGYRLTYREDSRYFSIVFKLNNEKYLQFVKGNKHHSHIYNVRKEPYALREMINELALYLNYQQ